MKAAAPGRPRVGNKLAQVRRTARQRGSGRMRKWIVMHDYHLTVADNGLSATVDDSGSTPGLQFCSLEGLSLRSGRSNENSYPVRCARHDYPAAVQLRNGFDQRQPQTGVLSVATGVIQSVKRSKICGKCSGLMPSPLSSTLSTI